MLITTRRRPEEQTDEVYQFLSSLELGELLKTVRAAAERGFAGQLIARSNAAARYERTKLLAAMQAVELARAPSAKAADRLDPPRLAP